MANEDQSKGEADGIPRNPPPEGTQDSIPTTPLGSEPLAPQPKVAATATAPTSPDKPGFFRRTWVWVTAAALAVLILLGGGIGIGYALSDGSDDSDGSSFEHPGHDGEDSDGHRGPPGHDDDGNHHGRGLHDDGGNPQERPTPAPSDTGTTNP